MSSSGVFECFPSPTLQLVNSGVVIKMGTMAWSGSGVTVSRTGRSQKTTRCASVRSAKIVIEIGGTGESF